MNILLVAGLLTFGFLHPLPEQTNKPNASQANAKPSPSPAPIDQTSPARPSTPKEESSPNGKANEPSWCERLLKPLVENWPVLSVAIWGIIVAIGTLKHMRESAERQMRAYVVGENGTIFNVANPVPVFPGQTFDPRCEAAITNPAFGPGYKLQIKNSGQTPAYDVRHWGNILFREFPLKSDLPKRDAKIIPTACVLGPGISSTKFNYLFHPLTAQEVADLRAGNGAVYVYGEITYKDTFGKSWYTRYRLMHHASGGAIGVSTDLSFCESGNEAN
jgi:hypothetical protein